MRLETTEYRDVKIEQLKEKVSKFDRKPFLAIVVANGYSDASAKYVKNKHILAEKIGIETCEFPVDCTLPPQEFVEDVKKLIGILNKHDKIDGIIVQLPMPHIDENEIASLIAPEKDVDGFHPINLGKLMRGEDCLASCTPKGIMDYIDYLGVELKGKNVCIVGRSNIVGKPLANMMINKGATVTVCNSNTQILDSYTFCADIVVTAIGKPKYFKSYYFDSNTLILDVGINFLEGKMCGDCDYDDIVDMCDITPVPKGVGQLTVLALMENVIKAYEMKMRG